MALGFRDALVGATGMSPQTRGGQPASADASPPSAADAAAAATFFAQHAFLERYSLREVVQVGAELIRSRQLLRPSLTGALTREVTQALSPGRVTLAIWRLDAVRVWHMDEFLRTAEGPRLLGLGLPCLLKAASQHCDDTPTETALAFSEILCELVLKVYVGNCSTRGEAQQALASLRTQWRQWLVDVDALELLSQALLVIATRVRPKYAASRCLMSELQQLLLSSPQASGDVELHGYEAWAAAPGRLQAPLSIVVRAVGVAAVVDLLDTCLDAGEPNWTVAMPLFQQAAKSSDSALGHLQNLVDRVTTFVLEAGQERHLRGALFLTRALCRCDCDQQQCDEGCHGELPLYGSRLACLLEGEAGNGEKGLASSHRAMHQLLQLLIMLVPHDSLSTLRIQREALSTLSRRPPLLVDYLQISAARISELTSMGKPVGSGIQPGMAVPEADRLEAARRTNEFVEAGFRIPQSFLNMVRNWKRKWFDEHLLPALVEPIMESGQQRDARLHFLEALAAKHVAPSSAPRRFELLCEAASRDNADLTIPADATFAALVDILPRVIARAPEAQALAGLEQLNKAVDSELQGSMNDSAGAVVEAMLEMTVAVSREHEGRSEVGLGWLLSVVKLVTLHQPLHRPFWHRIRHLCLRHGSEMDAHQLFAVASLLACCSVLRRNGGNTVVNEYSRGDGFCPSFIFELSDDKDAEADRRRRSGGEMSSELVTEVIRSDGLACWAMRLMCGIVVAVTSVSTQLTCSLQRAVPPVSGALDDAATATKASDDEPQILGYLPPAALQLLGWLDYRYALQQSLAFSSNGVAGQAPSGEMAELHHLHSKLASPFVSSPVGRKLIEAAGPPPVWMMLALETAWQSPKPTSSSGDSNGLSSTVTAEAAAHSYLQQLTWQCGQTGTAATWERVAIEIGRSLGQANRKGIQHELAMDARKDRAGLSLEECQRWASAAWPLLAALQDAPWRLTDTRKGKQPAQVPQKDWTVRLVACLLAESESESSSGNTEKAASRSVLSKLVLAMLLRVSESSAPAAAASDGQRLHAVSAVVSSCMVGIDSIAAATHNRACTLHAIESKLTQLIDAYDIFSTASAPTFPDHP